jgi:quinol monooxygenase YgiN
MSISLVAALVGTLAAAVGTVVLAVRCARAPRVDLIAWAIAAAGLTIALAAQAVGYRNGFGPMTFRAVQLGAQMVAPLALVWGITEVAARSLPGRFAARLLFSALAVVAVVILGTDPLSAQAFSKSWPAASVHYQVLPNALLTLIAVVTVVSALAGVAVVGVRALRDRAWRDGFAAAGVAAVAALATEGLAIHLPASSGYPVLCLLAAGLAVLAAVLAGRFQPAVLRAAHGSGDEAGWGAPARSGAGGSRQYAADDSLGLYRDSGYRGYPEPAGEYGGDGYGRYGGAGYSGADADYDEGPVTGAFEGPVTGAFEGPVTAGFDGPDPGGFDGPVTGAFDPLLPHDGGHPGRGDNGDRERPGRYPQDENAGPGVAPPAAGESGAAGLAGEQDTERFYGQIAIYTLLEHGATEFDRLADQVVEQVRAHEPGTLVYVVHSVPSAPLQRILYEVYRDQAAHDEHTQQPYIQKFDVSRRPLVLATNVIELGVRQAKVSPLAASPGPAPGSPQGRPQASRPPLAPPLARPPLAPPPDGLPYGNAPGGRARGDRPGGRAL